MEVSFLRTATRKEHYPKSHLPQIAFSGRSNVGKSSLINSLVGSKKVARTSARPGHTQAINFFNVDQRWIFVDLPGYGFARAPAHVRAKWGPMIEEFINQQEKLKLAILIVDSRHEPTHLDLMMRDYLVAAGVPFQTVATKVDKLSGNQRQQSLARVRKKLEVNEIIAYSSATGIGKKELWRVIREV